MPERIKVSEIMSEHPMVVDVEESIQKAAIIMRENNISGLIVVKKKYAVAMVTIKDLAIKILAENRLPQNTIIKDVMSSTIITASLNENLSDVGMKMVKNDISRMPVLDEQNNIAGIVTKTDLLRVMPSMINLFYERENEKEIIPVAQRTITEGICRECGNHSDELKDVDGYWLCEECGEIKAELR